MNKKIIILLISICMVVVLVGCNNTKSRVNDKENINENDNSEEIVKIMESVYLDYLYDIYIDKERYLGKTIEIEGMFTQENSKDTSKYYVYRLSDSTHEHDGQEHTEEVMTGLEFIYDKEIPKENDWIKVRGILKEKDDGSIYINAKSVQIMKERGLEKINLRSDSVY